MLKIVGQRLVYKRTGRKWQPVVVKQSNDTETKFYFRDEISVASVISSSVSMDQTIQN
jgi:hypothetical protein